MYEIPVPFEGVLSVESAHMSCCNTALGGIPSSSEDEATMMPCCCCNRSGITLPNCDGLGRLAIPPQLPTVLCCNTIQECIPPPCVAPGMFYCKYTGWIPPPSVAPGMLCCSVAVGGIPLSIVGEAAKTFGPAGATYPPVNKALPCNAA